MSVYFNTFISNCVPFYNETDPGSVTDNKIYAFVVIGKVLEAVALVSLPVIAAVALTVAPYAWFFLAASVSAFVLGKFLANMSDDSLPPPPPPPPGVHRPIGVPNHSGKACWAICVMQLIMHVPSLEEAIMNAPEFAGDDYRVIKDFIQRYRASQDGGVAILPNFDMREIHQALAVLNPGIDPDVGRNGDAREGLAALTQHLADGSGVNNTIHEVTFSGGALDHPDAIIPVCLANRDAKGFDGLFREYFFPEQGDHGVPRSRKFADDPREFIINMQRLTYDFSGGRLRVNKIRDRIDIPEELVVDGDCYVNDEGQKRYVCDFFIEHKNGVNNGHYVCYVKQSDGWIRCDNNRVQMITEEQARDAMGVGYLYHFTKV